MEISTKEGDEMKEKKQKKKKQANVPPKIEIEFIGQKEEEARIEQEKRLRAEKEAKKKKKKKEQTKTSGKISQVDFSQKSGKKKQEVQEENPEELDFTIQGLVEEEENEEFLGEETAKEPEKIVEKKPQKPKKKSVQKQAHVESDKIKQIPKTPKKSKKKWGILVGILCFIGVILVSLYFTNETFQENVDEYVFRKNKQSEDLISIPLDASENPKVIAYNGMLSVLAENNLKVYNAVGNLSAEIELKVNDPIYATNGRYLVIGEKNSQKLYLVDHTNIAWENDIEGNIARVTVNRNGYSAIVITGTSYKSIVAVYDEKGKELFKIYLATTSVADIALSEDNQYLGIAEIDTTGTQIQSIIKMVEIEKAQSSPNDSIVSTYRADAGNLIVDIAYQSRGRLICMYDNSIHLTTLDADEELMRLKDEEGNTNFADINLNNAAYLVQEKSAGLFKANTVLEIMNTSSKKKTVHTVDGIAKSTVASGNTIVLNLGSEVEFLTDSGWVSKRYTTSKAIKEIVVNGNIAGIVYRDQVEIINL